ncbi:hemolysin family protein [Spirosoma utsteinense]|uniref:Hemolysin n=1 Tax=Spirosoma utsteinense TaxID=2585773 RepID=A0ABR6W1Y7_9BACT|nr:hemolysin family protein [Spirosoma utsteinense]MBC3785195.1 putative hemolysin [Spirosoma utsteinense]MBC3790580.1 putative hemolysin [Spirosoma utsteinense]
MEILLILLLTILNGVFSMSEIALVSSRRSKLETAAKNGDRQAQVALDLFNSPNRFLSTVQIGITLIGILLGIFSGDKLTTDVQNLVAQVEIVRPYAHSVAVVLVLLFLTYVSLVFGELVPKRIGMSNPEGIAKAVAAPMILLSRLTSPFIALLTLSSDLLLKLLRIRPNESAVTEEEIKSLIQEGTSGGAIEEIEQEIVQNVFQLGDRKITSLMTNRQEIVYLDLEDEPAENREKILNYRHSVFPLCNGGVDDVVGLIYTKDLLGKDLDTELLRLRDVKRDALFVPENNRAYQVLERFRERKQYVGIIVDEYGGVLGMVTLNDILDVLVGDINDDTDSDYEIRAREDGTYLIDAQIPFEDFLSYFSITVSAQTRRDLTGFDTLGGFALHILKDIPQTGETFIWQAYRFEIVDMDKSRIDKILVSKLDEE